MKRRGFTIVEISVALLVGTIALVVAFNAIILLTKGERSTDRAASKALTDSRLMSILLMDVRSSTGVTPPGASGEYQIERWFAAPGGGLEKKIVTWKTIQDPKNPRVTRQVAGESKFEEFSYRGQEPDKSAPNAPPIDPQSLAVKFKIERLNSDVTFP